METVKLILKLFSPCGSRTILIFLQETLGRHSDRVPLTGASNAVGILKIAIYFLTIILLYLENDTRQDHS